MVWFIASAGNHAPRVATCNEMRIPAAIFMPVTTPLKKLVKNPFLWWI